MNDELDVGAPEEFIHCNLRAVNTCWACPEQYDVFRGERRVGYLRLRHGRFTVEAFHLGNELDGAHILDAYPLGDGQFYDEERAGYLTKALEAIDKWLAKQV